MKYLTDEDTRFKGKEHYDKLKKRFNKRDINVWYEDIYRHPSSIGFVSTFFKNADPKTLEQAYDMYILSGILDRDLPKENRGRTKEEIEEMAIDWKEKCGVDFPLVDFYDALILHAVIETCFGMIMERRAEDAYRLKGFTIEETDGYTDRNCGIDFVARKGEKTFLVQVKPISFFRGKGEKLTDDRKVVIHSKHKAGLSLFPNASYAYMIYDSDEKWINLDGRFNFRYDEFVNNDGSMKVNIDSSIYEHADSII